MDTQLFLKINGFAKSTTFAHGFAHEYAVFVGLALLGIAVLATIVRALLAGRGTDTDRQIAIALVTGIGAVVGFVINQPISHALNRSRPFLTLPGVEVLVHRSHDGGLPSDHATVAGAVIMGLWLAKDHKVAIFATIAGVLLAFIRVYVGVHYPVDVLAGLALGAVTVLVAYVVLGSYVTHLVGQLRRNPAAQRAATLDVPVTRIPRSTPVLPSFTPTGSVKLLSDHPLTPKPRITGSDGGGVSDVRNS